MKIYEILWKERFVEKISDKHSVAMEEVEDVLFSHPHVRKAGRGRIRGEDLFVAYGQTESGRYLTVFFVRKRRAVALPISARDMTRSERSYYNAQKKEKH